MQVLNMDPQHVRETPASQLFDSGLTKPEARASATRVHVVFTMLDLLDSFLDDVPLNSVFREFSAANTPKDATEYIQSLFVAIFKFHRGADAKLPMHCINARSAAESISVLEAVCGSRGLLVAEDAGGGCCAQAQ